MIFSDKPVYFLYRLVVDPQRQYDSRIGRWLAVDPYRQYYSPYVGMGNNPVSGVDADGGSVDDIIKVNTRTGRTEVYETGGPDVLFVDGQYMGISGADGDWRYQGYDNVAYYPDMSYYFNNTFGDLLLSDNFFAGQYAYWSDRGLGGEMMAARVRQGINTNGTFVAGVSVGTSLAIIGVAELAVLSPTISGNINAVYWRAGSLYNKLNLAYNEAFFKAIYISTPYVARTRLGKDVIMDLVIRQQLQGFDIGQSAIQAFYLFNDISTVKDYGKF